MGKKSGIVFLYQKRGYPKRGSLCWSTLLKQEISDKPTWLLSSGCSRFVKLCSFDFLYPVRRTIYRNLPFLGLIYKLGQNELSVYRAGIKALSETYSPRWDPFPRCNVKNSAFTALGIPTVISALRWALYASGTLVVSHVSNIYVYANVKQIS